MIKLEFTTERSKATPVVKHEFSKIYLHDNYAEVMLNYDFNTRRSKEDVEYLEIVRLHQIIPKVQLAISRTFYTNDLEERPGPDELSTLYHAIILEYQSREFWLYMNEEEANKVFKALRQWLVKAKE